MSGCTVMCILHKSPKKKVWHLIFILLTVNSKTQGTTCTCTHTYTHAHKHTLTQIGRHTHTQNINAPVHTHTHTHTHTHAITLLPSVHVYICTRNVMWCQVH